MKAKPEVFNYRVSVTSRHIRDFVAGATVCPISEAVRDAIEDSIKDGDNPPRGIESAPLFVEEDDYLPVCFGGPFRTMMDAESIHRVNRALHEGGVTDPFDFSFAVSRTVRDLPTEAKAKVTKAKAEDPAATKVLLDDRMPVEKLEHLRKKLLTKLDHAKRTRRDLVAKLDANGDRIGLLEEMLAELPTD